MFFNDFSIEYFLSLCTKLLIIVLLSSFLSHLNGPFYQQLTCPWFVLFRLSVARRTLFKAVFLENIVTTLLLFLYIPHPFSSTTRQVIYVHLFPPCFPLSFGSQSFFFIPHWLFMHKKKEGSLHIGRSVGAFSFSSSSISQRGMNIH